MSKLERLSKLTQKRSDEEVQGREAKKQIIHGVMVSKESVTTHAQSQSNTHAIPIAESEFDPAKKLLSRIGNKKKKMEDERKRRTYWLTDEEIKMISELAKMTGMDKYEVVAVAVKSMYARAKAER